MSKTKKNNTSKIIVLLLGILLISLIIALTVISLTKKETLSSPFNKEAGVSSEKLYQNLLDLSEETYPETPKEVVSLYADAYKLLYGDKIKQDYIKEVVPIILKKQRLLLSDKLSNSNPLENQISLVIQSIQNLSKNKLKVTMIEYSDTIYDQKDSKLAYVNVTIQDNIISSSESTKYYYKFFLEKDMYNKWHITSFYPADKEFNLLK